MEYFLLTQSKKVINPIKVVGPNVVGYYPEMTHKQFRELDSLIVAYAQYDRMQEIPDILAHPTYMISDEIKKVFAMYDENISFKAIQVFPDKPEFIKEAAKTYWVYDCVMEECLHESSVKLPNGEFSKLIIDKHKVRGRDIFRPKGLLENKVLVSLAAAESILRRNPYGLNLEIVELR